MLLKVPPSASSSPSKLVVGWNVKAILAEDKIEATVAYFDIERDDVLEQIGVDRAANVGGRESNGVEISPGSFFVPGDRVGQVEHGETNRVVSIDREG